jgi:hypothetical protein
LSGRPRFARGLHFSRWLRAVSAVVVLALVGTLLTPGSPASAEDLLVDRDLAVADMLSGGPSLRRAAKAALLGGDDEMRAFTGGVRETAQEADERAAAQVLAGMDGPAMRTAALAALGGSRAQVQAFVSGGYQASWDADERVRVHRILDSDIGLRTREAAERALSGSKEDLTEFLVNGLDTAQRADDRLAATRMLTGGVNNSGPVLDAAAQQALAATPDELREFLTTGQFVARARDAELASIRSLTQQAKEAGELTARESLAASEASTRAVNAAAEAKKAAQVAAAETAAAGNSAAKASAAAGRAADAAENAADAARDAIGASNAAMRAASIAADAARKATTAASLTAQAAARAQRAAAAARTDASKAALARQAAEAARDAAAKARQLEQVKAERDRALAQAKAATNAAKSASSNAADAANAADQAGNHSGVSQAEAQRARDAAARARAAAAAAARAADRAFRFAEAAARASDEAFRYAQQAAQHAEAAAAAADDAAAHAGDAARAAAESNRHAAAASTAANTAVTAANQAVQLEQLAREEDATRLAEATEQGVLAAQEALQKDREAAVETGELGEWNRKVLWDTAEEDRIDPATRALLAEATAAGAPTEVVLDRGRKAAAALTVTGGEWTRDAAAEALAGGEVELRSWLTSDRRFAVGQDDRSRVWRLVDTLPDGPEKTAAQNSLNGADTAVESFLRTRNYAGKTARDRQTAYAILNANPGPNLRSATEQALAGTAAQLHQFLRTGQYTARTADDRLEVYRVMEAGGPEVKAAAQVALAGPASYISYFLTASRYQAAQRDAEQAAHVSAVRALIEQAQQYAQTALSDAAEANRVAAVANNKAAEAANWANQAAQSAQRAAEYAADAQDSAAAARNSANQAAQSANTARNAANQAQASANSAAQSAATATAAAQRATRDAGIAREAAWAARASAKAAGADAAAANAAAKQASAIYAQRLKEFEAQRRSTAPGSGTGGGTALDDHKTWGCLVSTDVLDKTCLNVYKDFGKALLDPAKCSAPANSGTPGCTMLADLKSFVDENPELLLDMLQFVLGLCGLVPGVGEVCDAADAAVSFKRGDWVGGLLSLGAAIPGIGYLAAGAKGLKNADKLRNIKNIISKLAKGCNSFAPGTPILLANGVRRAIEDVREGDEVVSTDPETGRTTAKPVTATIVGSGTKSLVTVALKGHDGKPGGKVTATDEHPFWVPELRAWVPAGALRPGQWLRTGGGTWAQIATVAKRTEPARVHNLSVADYRTYYVFAGRTPLLVHNASQCFLPKPLYEGDLGEAVLRYRLDNRIDGGQNLAIVEWEINGVKQSKIFPNDPGGLHSEQLMDQWLRDNGVSADQVKRVYSERVPCTKEANGRTCLGIAQSYPNAEVSYSLTGTKRENRKAIMDIMIRGRR